MIFYFAASKEFIESRRRSLKRFLNIIARHPIINDDKIFVWFLTTKGSVSLALLKRTWIKFVSLKSEGNQGN